MKGLTPRRGSFKAVSSGYLGRPTSGVVFFSDLPCRLLGFLEGGILFPLHVASLLYGETLGVFSREFDYLNAIDNRHYS